MTATVYAKTTTGFDVVVAKRKARKTYRCESNRATNPPNVMGCLSVDPHIQPGETYMEVYEGDDQFHPLRYHTRCAVEEWALTGETKAVHA